MIVFRPNFNCIISGPTQSGKSTLVRKILQNVDTMFEPKIDQILWCYDQYQPLYDTISSKVTFHEGIPDMSNFKSSGHTLLILDDLMEECASNSTISKLFSVHSHHKNLSVFYITQTLFPRGQASRTLSLNTHYFIVFRNPRDQTSFGYLARQMYSSPKSKHLIEAYNDATRSRAHSYLFLDLKQDTDECLRVRTGILPSDEHVVYLI